MSSTGTRHPTDWTVAYLRVSTDEQTESGAGLDAQRAAIEGYAARCGLEVHAWHVDAGVSGSIAPADRPAFGDALMDLSRGKSGVLIVAKPDRIARKAADLLALRDLSEGQGWSIAAADGSLDNSTPHGRAMTGMMGVFAELERDLIRTRTREALAARKASGVRLGRPVTLDGAVRDRIVTERQGGSTLQAIADGLNAESVPTARGGARWRPSQIRAVLLSVDRDRESGRLLGPPSRSC